MVSAIILVYDGWNKLTRLVASDYNLTLSISSYNLAGFPAEPQAHPNCGRAGCSLRFTTQPSVFIVFAAKRMHERATNNCFIPRWSNGAVNFAAPSDLLSMH